MKVFRVQDAEGRGPWRPGFSRYWVEDRPDLENLLPWMQDFGAGIVLDALLEKEMFGAVFGCGCATADQLRRWFSRKEYARLVAFGYRSVEIVVDRIVKGNEKQLVFQRKNPLSVFAMPFNLY